MILGIGIDVCDLDRFAEALRRTPDLAERLFTPDERPLPPASLAARFAAKEAIAKALGAPAALLLDHLGIVPGQAGRVSCCAAPWRRRPTRSASPRCTCR